MMFAVVRTHYVKDFDSDYLDGYGDVLAIRSSEEQAEQAAQTYATRLAQEYAEENSCAAVAEFSPQQGYVIATNRDPWGDCDEDDSLDAVCDVAVMRVFVVLVSDCC